MKSELDLKLEAIKAWFNEMEEIIEELKSLSDKKHRLKIIAPVLYTMLERMASRRYCDEISSGKKFKKLLLNYSNDVQILKKVDIAFLFQWDISAYKNERIYISHIKPFHRAIKETLRHYLGQLLCLCQIDLLI